MTVWALPSRDLQTIAVLAPRADASIAARRPAPPAPMTTTSYSWICCSDISNNLSLGLANEPGEEHVAGVQRGGPAPQPEAHRRLGEAVDVPAAQVPAGVARQRVQPQEHRVDHQHQRAQAHAPAVTEVEALDAVPQQDDRERQRQVEEVAVDVLEDQRELGLAAVARPRVAD